jgi:hypothetical protein
LNIVAIINGDKEGEDRITTFLYDEPGPVPPIVNLEDPEKAKDGGVPGADEVQTGKWNMLRKPS